MGLKYLEVADFHFSKSWASVSQLCAESVRNAAVENKVDFIATSGDFFDSPILASDKGGMDIAQNIMKSWTDVCPVIGIEGTPSHDAPGCYGLFDGMNFTLLQPGKVYGYDRNTNKIVEGEGADCLLVGVPELNKNNIMAQLNLSAEQANAKAVDLFGDYIDEFIAPMRLKYKDIPAIGLLHGNVSDSRQENSTDIILRSSDIVIHTETLARANFTRWILGHLHGPWESKITNCGYPGYPGIDRNPWGKRDFVPAMNLVEFDAPKGSVLEHIPLITRIPYGTPMRIKLSEPEPEYNPAIAYWLDTDNPDDVLPTGHPWSRITYREDKTETRRVSADEAEKARTLWDLFKLIDLNVRPELKPLVDSIPVKENATGNKLDARLTSVKVKGCTLFGGKTVEFDLTDLATGLNQLIGTNGNGDGKSSLLGMCSLYPVVIGKDTKSGRQSALKDFFSGQDSNIEKTGIVNGAEHHHKITIKGAHTQTPKVECYLDIDGISQLEKATFDTMMEKCEELYGNYEDYLITTFYEQPQQSKNQRSGLMTATGTDARNLIQNIADIDKESEKRFALDRVAEAEKKGQQLESDINALEEYSEDVDDLELKQSIKVDAIVASGLLLKETEKKGNTAKVAVDSIQLEVTKNEKAKTQKMQIEKQVKSAENSIKTAVNNIDELKETVKELSGNQELIKKDDTNRKLELDYSILLIEYNKKISAYSLALSGQENLKKDSLHIISNNETQIENIKRDIQQKYSTAVQEQDKLKRDYQNTINNAELEKRSTNKEIELISKPCPQCGYIDPDIQENIDGLNGDIGILDDKIKEAFEAMDKLKSIPEPESTNDEIRMIENGIVTLQEKIDSMVAIPEPDINEPVKPTTTTLSDFERSETEKAITEGLQAETTIKGLEQGIIKDSKLLEAYHKELNSIIIDPLLNEKLETANTDLNTIRHLYSETQNTISTLNAEKKALDNRIEKALEGEKNLDKKKTALMDTEANHVDWTYIAKMLNPDKIPALELDMVVDSIDAKATRNIEPFLEGRYSFHTVTQQQGKKSTVDKFDILIHDGTTGESFSMFYTNPGNKAFYSDCYIKALIRKRNERQQRSYSPIVYDEADGPVNPLRVKAYYDIQQEYFKDEKVILVSQKDITGSYVEKIFNIEEMKS